MGKVASDYVAGAVPGSLLSAEVHNSASPLIRGHPLDIGHLDMSVNATSTDSPIDQIGGSLYGVNEDVIGDLLADNFVREHIDDNHDETLAV